jgi:hypothetical protein
MFNQNDMNRLGRAVKFTEKVPALKGDEQYRRGMPGGSPLYVHVTKDGGTLGSDSTTCTATYTVKSLTDHDMKDGSSSTATSKSPLWNRASWTLANVRYSAPGATDPCLAMYDKSNPPNLILLYVTEKPSVSNCALFSSSSSDVSESM